MFAFLCVIGLLASAQAQSQFEYTISNDDLSIAETGKAMGFNAIAGGGKPCLITMSLSDPKIGPNKLTLEFKFADKTGLQSGDYAINPDADVSSSWSFENQQQVRAMFIPQGSHKLPLKKMQGIDGLLTIKRDGLNIAGNYEGTFAEYGFTALGKRKIKSKASVKASFEHVMKKGMKDFSNAYLCK